MRMYSSLCKRRLEAKVEFCKQMLSDLNFVIPQPEFGEYVFGRNSKNINHLALKQYLCFRLLRIDLNKQIILGLSNKKIVFPMPSEWRSLFQELDISVSAFSKILWWGYIVFFFFYGVFTFLQQFKFFAFRRRGGLDEEPYFYFINLGQERVATENEPYKKYTTLQWFVKFYEDLKDVKSFRHSVGKIGSTYYLNDRKIQIQKSFTQLYYNDGMAILRFFCWGVVSTFRILIDLLRGRWWNVLMFSEGVKLKLANLATQRDIAKNYFFCNTNPIYRPLWTYELKRRGVESTFYFYSTNQDFYSGINVVDQTPFSWRNLNWDKYLVWDKYQKDFIIRAGVDPSKIILVGCIWHIDNNLEWSIDRKNCIIVFDITPYRASQIYQQGADIAYLNESVMIKYLGDILLLANKYQLSVIYKKKRNSWRHSKKYINKLNQMSSEGYLTICDPNIAPLKILENAMASISVPYTSSALISRDIGVTSIYYDPIGMLKNSKHLTHGISLISGREQLDEWFCNLLSISKE